MSCFPRASGDGPYEQGERLPDFPFPPRERGWSRTPYIRMDGTRVSPARAGMVPVSRRAERRLVSFPRASGDGPSSRAYL